MSRVNILYTSHTSEFKMGGQISLFNFVKRLDRIKYRPILVCPGEGSLSQRFKEIDCSTVYHQFYRLKGVNLFRIIVCILHTIKLLREHQIGLIHSDHPTDTFYLVVCSRVLRIPLIWHARVSFSSRLDYFNCRLASKILSVSNSVRKRFLPFDKDSQKHATVYNAVDCELYKPNSGKEKRERFGFGKDKMIVTTVCQLIKEKGILEFIEAAKKVCSKIELCRFIIAGEGTEKFTEELHKIIKRKGLEEYVTLLGFREDIAAVLNDSDLFVLASYIEGFPRVVIEAMACGKPVVGTDVEGVNEVIQDHITGLLVPPRDPERLSEAIAQILMDEERMKAMGQAGRKRAEELFSIFHHVARIENIYKEVLTQYDGSE
jgi:glycosyltransferase involved in cell wall biosynthesis